MAGIVNLLRRRGRERPAPGWVWLLFVSALTLQLVWTSHRPAPTALAADLPEPPSLAWLRLAAMGEEVALARILMLWLQAFDNQPGVSIPFKELDYPRVGNWLARIQELDQVSRYPLFAASGVYATVADLERKRWMADWVYRHFFHDPPRRWFALANMAVVAKHALNDLPLALKYARAIRQHATPQMPHWATQMELFLLEDMGELESARILLGGLLASGQVTDPHELNFLLEKLKKIAIPADDR